MAFVPPILSATPPPMSPDDTLEDVSVATDEAGGDVDGLVEDDDDLTGLSGKLHSIPIEAMRAPPPPSPGKECRVPETVEEAEYDGSDGRDVDVDREESDFSEAQAEKADPTPTGCCETEKDPDDLSKDDFCDFESAFPEPVPEGANDAWAQKEPVTQVQSGDDDDDDDDDEDDDGFGDFGEVSTFQRNFGSTDPITDFIEKMEHETETVICRLFDAGCDNDAVESPVPDSLKSAKEQDAEIWPKISDVGATPSLGFVWKRSRCVDRLYNLLNIDQSVASTMENSQRLQNVPAFASGLTTTGMLEPMPLTSVLKPTVPDPQSNTEPTPQPHNGNGIAVAEILDEVITPDCAPVTLVGAQIISDLSEGLEGSKKKPALSQEAKAVVDAFPLLDFMRSPVLMFPIKAGDGGDPKE